MPAARRGFGVRMGWLYHAGTGFTPLAMSPTADGEADCHPASSPSRRLPAKP